MIHQRSDTNVEGSHPSHLSGFLLLELRCSFEFIGFGTMGGRSPVEMESCLWQSENLDRLVRKKYYR